MYPLPRTGKRNHCKRIVSKLFKNDDKPPSDKSSKTKLKSLGNNDLHLSTRARYNFRLP